MQQRHPIFLVWLAVLLTLDLNPLAYAQFADVADRQLRVAINPSALETKLLDSTDQKKFNSAIWQASEFARQKMVLSLLRMNLFSKNRNEVRILLGEPSATRNGAGEVDIYELGEFEGRKIALQIHYYQEKPSSLYICQHCEPGFLHFKATDWHWKDPDMKDAAKDFNRSFLVVGCPVKHLCQIMGHPQKEGAIWKCGSIELEYTPDNQKVKRFRMAPDHHAITDTTDWETDDLRTVDGSYATSMAVYLRHDDLMHIFNKPLMKFDKSRWDNCWNRDFMLFDLGRNYKLISKTRSEIREHFGQPQITESTHPPEFNGKELKMRFAQHKPYTKFDWYALKGTGCCIPSDPGLYLELVYKETNGIEVVAGYRVIESDVFRDGEKEILGVALNELYEIRNPRGTTGK